MYTRCSTVNDTMKEYLIYGSELTNNGFPELLPVNCVPEDTVDFSGSFSKKIKRHRNLNVNFYTDDQKFIRLENNPDKYIEHLKCFHSLCGLDFSIDTQMPLVMQMYNKYRSMALDWYLTVRGITVIPSVSITPYKGREWLLEGVPNNSTICCSSIGRIRRKSAREEFCKGFYEMCEILTPLRVIIVGIIPDELNASVEIINLKNRCQKMRESYPN